MAAATPLTTPRVLFARSPDDLKRASEEGLAECRKLLKRILRKKKRRTVGNTLRTYDALTRILDEVAVQSQFLTEVHPDPAMRDAGDKMYQEAERFRTELDLNRDLFDAFTALDASKADAETRFAASKILRDFRRSGVDRDEPTRAAIKALRDEITSIGQAFDKTIREDTRSIRVAGVADLEGLPEDYVRSHAPAEDGTIEITTNYPDSLPVFRYAKNPDVRKRLQFEFLNRGHPANLEVLGKLLARRHALARTLGYDSYAAYITEDKMIGSAQAAADFVAKVTAAATPIAQKDVARLLERKREDIPGATALDPWDTNYYAELVRAEEHDFDTKKFRAYFRFERVRDGLFELTGLLFGVRYERVADLPVWHESVESYDVFEGDRHLGRVYLDLHPRKDKYGHAAAVPLLAGVKGAQLPHAALMCNFPDPRTSDGPALMDHQDVVTFFHEFGHLLHMVFSTRKWVRTTMNDLEWDVVEAPSQMLEEWVRNPEPLRAFAKHVDTGEPIPEDLVERMERADGVARAFGIYRQLLLASISLRYYGGDPSGLDTTEVMKDVYRRFPLLPFHEGTHFQCNFGHLNGYSAVYYTYMWSLVIAKDLFRKFERSRTLLNPKLALRYRRTILDSGASRPAAESIKAFLGRDMSFDAFEDWLRRAAS
jgi:thimet oligopeptidase